MKARLAIQMIIFAMIALLLVSPAQGQQGGIIINNADAQVNVAVSSSATLSSLISNLPSRFQVWRANGIRYYEMKPFSKDLEILLGQVRDRFIVQYANANRFYTLTYPVALFGDTTPPQISDVKAVLSDTGIVKITWFTNEFASSVLEWGVQSGNYGNTANEPQYFKLHEVNIPGLSAGQTIFYRMRHTDRSGNAMQGGEYSYTVPTPRRLVYMPIMRR